MLAIRVNVVFEITDRAYYKYDFHVYKAVNGYVIDVLVCVSPAIRTGMESLLNAFIVTQKG